MKVQGPNKSLLVDKGKYYHMVSAEETKAKATRRAARMRKEGRRARVVKIVSYNVYGAASQLR